MAKNNYSITYKAFYAWLKKKRLLAKFIKDFSACQHVDKGVSMWLTYSDFSIEHLTHIKTMEGLQTLLWDVRYALEYSKINIGQHIDNYAQLFFEFSEWYGNNKMSMYFAEEIRAAVKKERRKAIRESKTDAAGLGPFWRQLNIQRNSWYGRYGG